MRELKRFTESIILVVSVIAFMMFGSAAAAYADDNTFTSYSDAQQYIYQNVMEMNPEIDYTLKLSSMSDFDQFSSTSISGLTALDNGIGTDGDYAALDLYNGDNFSYSCEEQNGQYIIHVRDQVSYRLSKSQEQEYQDKLNSVMRKVAVKGNTEKKVKSIYSYVTKNVKYDYSSNLKDTAYTAYAALVNKKAVCNGYAPLVYDMCRKADIPCRIIVGTANGGCHAWNLIKVNGKWYNADATWDAGNHTYRYFMKSDKQFRGHKRAAAYSSSRFKRLCPSASKSLKVS